MLRLMLCKPMRSPEEENVADLWWSRSLNCVGLEAGFTSEKLMCFSCRVPQVLRSPRQSHEPRALCKEPSRCWRHSGSEVFSPKARAGRV